MIDERRTQIDKSLCEAQGYGLSKEEIRNALGFTAGSWEKVQQALARKTNTKKDESTLSKKLAKSSKGLVTALSSLTQTQQREQVGTYTEHIADQFDKFNPGEIHVLVSVLPPLECVEQRVSHAVVRSALNGVSFDYQFLSPKTLKFAFPTLDAPKSVKTITRQTVDQQFEQWDGRFNQIPSAKVIARRMQTELLSAFKQISAATSLPEIDLQKLMKNVTFRELDWVPLMFNEKLTWCTSLERSMLTGTHHHVIRKEIVLPDSLSEESGIYSENTEWVRLGLSLPNDIVDELVSGIRGKTIDWPRQIEDAVND